MKCKICGVKLVGHSKHCVPVGFPDEIGNELLAEYLWCPQCGLMYQFIKV